MKLVDKISSKKEHVIKYVFKTEDELILEFTYINKNDGKDIICVPSETMCNLGCKFCHCTDYIGKLKVRNVSCVELFDGVEHIYEDVLMRARPRTLLISWMGCGEPMNNTKEIISAMRLIREHYETDVRFAIATCLPKKNWVEFFKFTNAVKENNLNVKIHLSLHYVMDTIRKHWMPAVLDIIPSISAVDFFKKMTGNNIEIHYTLIDGVNDSEQDAILLAELIKDKDFNVKFLFYSEREIIEGKPSPKERVKLFEKHFETYNIKSEYYIPPGLSISTSCGQFAFENFIKYKDS